MGRDDHDLKGQVAQCAFCGEIVAVKEITGKHHLLTVHMKQCDQHPMAKLDRAYRKLVRQKSGREREIEVLEQENKGLRSALQHIRRGCDLVGSTRTEEEALAYASRRADEALGKGDGNAKQGDS